MHSRRYVYHVKHETSICGMSISVGINDNISFTPSVRWRKREATPRPCDDGPSLARLSRMAPCILPRVGFHAGGHHHLMALWCWAAWTYPRPSQIGQSSFRPLEWHWTSCRAGTGFSAASSAIKSRCVPPAELKGTSSSALVPPRAVATWQPSKPSAGKKPTNASSSFKCSPVRAGGLRKQAFT